jgi:undecaprenol kinase
MPRTRAVKNQSFLRRLSFALLGLRTAWRTESSFKTHIVAAFAVVGVLLWLEPAPLWWAIAAVTIAFVLAAELFNTAVEGLADHLHPEQHPAIKAVKDCAAGAVLVASTAALAVAAAFVYDTVLR